MKTNKWYDDNKERILEMYYSNKRIIEICDKLKCNKSMIYKKFNEWGIQRRNKIQLNERYNATYDVDVNYFENIDCEHKAYWLGFMVSDGFVNKKELSFCLKKEDIKAIEDFRNDLKSNHPIKFNKDGNPFITIVCNKICKALYSYGLHNRKSWDFDIKKIVDKIPEEYEHHFIRGLFDGDGSIRYYNYPYLNKPQFHFGYTGLKNVCEYVQNKLGIERKLVYEGNVTYTVVTRNLIDIYNIFNYLYKDATIYLNRKYDTFLKIQMMTFNDYNKAIS